MMQYFKNIILCVATVLLLLHNLTPHQHHGEMTAAEDLREHQSSNFLDILRTIFHNDMGEQHHLENIKLVETDALFANEVSAEDESEDDDFCIKKHVTKTAFTNIFLKNYFITKPAFAANFYYGKNIAQSKNRHFYFYKC